MLPIARWLLAGCIATTITAAAAPTPDGNFVQRIPITVPRGPGAATPSLSLVYRSASVDGWAGRGFTIDGLPAIARMNHAQPIRYAADDALVGPHGRLFDVGGGAFHGANEDFAVYRPTGVCGTGPCAWTMQDRHGNTWSFGTTDDARIEGVDRGGSVRVWALARFEDRHGNAYTVSYDEDPVGGDYYPTMVRWGASTSSSTRTATFRWEPRVDHVAMFDDGARVDQDRRLREIEVASEGRLVERMTLAYDALDRLISIDETGADGATHLPLQRFTWSTAAPFQLANQTTVTPGVASQWSPLLEVCQQQNQNCDPNDVALAGDFDGNGTTDLFNRKGASLYTRYARSGTGPQTWSVVTKATNGRWGIGALTTVGDFDGDGRDDVLSLLPCSGCTLGGVAYTVAWVYYGQPGGLLSQQTEIMYTTPTTWNTGGYVWAADFDGDGRTDLATRTSSGVLVARSLGRTFARPEYWAGPPQWGVREATHVVDYDGDGRADLLTTTGRHIHVLRSTGIGFEPLSLFWPVNATGLASNRMWVGDWNGDRKTDLLASKSIGGGFSQLFACLSTGRSAPLACSETTTTDPFGQHNLAGDFDGDGRTDLLSVGIPLGWTDNGITATGALRRFGTAGFATRFYHSLWLDSSATLTISGDTDGNGQPDLIQANGNGDATIRTTAFATRLHRIVKIDNGLGGEVELEWTPQRLHPGAIDHAPSCGGTSTLPDCGIPDRSGRLLLTRDRAVTNGLALATTYQYAASRIVAGPPGLAAYLGFARVIARTATGVETLDQYRQAKPFAGVLAVHLVRVTNEDPIEPSMVTVLEVLHDPPAQVVCTEAGCTASSSPDPDAARQLRSTRARTRYYELGRLLFEKTTMPSYDAYGNAIAVTTWATNPTNVVLYEERRLTSYVNVTDPARRAIGIPYEGRLCVDPSCIEPATWTRTYFDALPLGMIGARHLVTTLETWSGGTTFAPTKYAYDVWGNLTSETAPDAQVRTFTYDAAFHALRTGERDPTTGETWIVPDDRWGVAVTTTNEAGLRVEAELDPFGRPRQQTRRHVTGPGPGVAYQHRELSMPTGPNAQNVTRSCDYFDGDGDPSTPFDASLCSATWADGFGRKLVTETASSGGPARVVIGYDAAGREARVSEPHLAGALVYETVKHYDRLGRPIEVIGPDGTTQTVRYNSVPLAPGAVTVVERTDGRGLRSQEHRDARGHVVRIIEGIATTCIPIPDPAPCCIAVELADARRKLDTPFTTPLDKLELYPSTLPKVRCTTSSGVMTDYVWDAHRRLVAIEGPDHITQMLTYDDAGRRTSIAHPAAGVTKWTYVTTPNTPGFGKVLTETRPAPNAAPGSGTTVLSTYAYDAKGRVAARADTDGVTVTFTYDEGSLTNRGRLTTARVTGGDLVVIERFGYDLDGNIASSTRRIETVAGELLATGTTTQTRDALGRIATTTYPDGSTLATSYYADSGHLAKLELDGTLHATFDGWDPRGRLGTIVLANGVRTQYVYTPERGLLKESSTTRGPQTFRHDVYQLDANGNVANIRDLVQPDLSTTYTYDALDRLRRAQRDDGTVFDYLTTDGGRLVVFSELDAAGLVVTRTRGIDLATGRLADDGVVPLLYGEGGALRERGDRTYAYDDQARLVSIQESGIEIGRNTYDHLHRRVVRIERPSPDVELRTYVLGDNYEVSERRVGGVVQVRRATRVIRGLDGGRLVALTADLATAGPIGKVAATFIPAGTVHIAVFGFSLLGAIGLWIGIVRRPRRRRYAHVVPLLVLAVFDLSACGRTETRTAATALTGGSSVDPAGTRYYTGDHVGSAVVITDTTGAELVRLAYTPYGGIDPIHSGTHVGGVIDPNASTPPIGFTGARLDREADLYELGRRFYDPTLGEFLTSDPIITDPDSTQGLAVHRYADNNPIKYADPSGHFAFLPILIGAAIGAAYGATDGFTSWSFDLGGAIGYGLAGAALGGLGMIGGGFALPGLGSWGVGTVSIGAMLQGGGIAATVAWHGGERDWDDLARIFVAGAIESGIYDAGHWRDPVGFFTTDVIGTIAVSAIRPGGGVEFGLGVARYNLDTERTHVSWGRMIHLGVAGVSYGIGRLGKRTYGDLSTKNLVALGNAGVISMAIDDSVVASIQFAARKAGLLAGDSPYEENASVRWGLEVGGVLTYTALRLGVAVTLVGTPIVAHQAFRTATHVFDTTVRTLSQLSVPMTGMPF